MDFVTTDRLNPQQLWHLLNVEEMVQWTQEDRAAALRHQLSAPLLPDLATILENDRSDLERGVASTSITFIDALNSATTSLAILEAVKRYGRAVETMRESPLSEAPATVLYFASIAAALLHHCTRISSLTDAELWNGFAWSAERPGAEALGSLFRQATAMLAMGR